MNQGYYKAKDYQVRRSIGHLIRATSARVTAQVETLFHERDISFIQYVVLMYLRDGMAKTPADLSQSARYDSGAMTRVLDQLEERGLLERKRCTDDRRVVRLRITPAGIKTAESLMPLVIAQYNEWLSDFTPEESDALIGLLSKFNDSIIHHSEKKD